MGSTEDGRRRPDTNISIYLNGNLHVNSERGIKSINIHDSYIDKIQAHNDEATDGQPDNTVEADSRNGTNPMPDPVAIAQPIASNEQGWIQLSEKTFMFNSHPLKKDASVYKGKQSLVEEGEWRDVAIKLIPYNKADLKEIQFHQTLETHPNIVRLYEVGKLKQKVPVIYIVMELCSQTLRDYIENNKKKPFNFKQRFSLAKQIIAGIAFIHEKRIIHRDIKLENILVTACNDFIRIADFGLCKKLNSDRSISSVTYRGLGSEGYQAPEILHEAPQASFRSDSFSLGIVLSMLFSNGHHPFGSDPIRWRTNILDNRGLDLSTIIQFEMPYLKKRKQLLDLIRRVLNPNPKFRPTPKAMLDHQFFSPGPSTPPPPSQKPVESDSNPALTKSKTEQGAIKQNSTSKSEVPRRLAPPIPRRQKRLSQVADGNKPRIRYLQDELMTPLNKIGYKKALQYLEELHSLRGCDDVDILLQIAECHLQLRSDKRDLSISKVAEFLATSTAEEAKKMAHVFYDKGDYVKSMILQKISNDLHKHEPTPNEEIDWLCDRVDGIFWAIRSLASGPGESGENDSRDGASHEKSSNVDGGKPSDEDDGKSCDIAECYGLKYMRDILIELRKVKDASPDHKTLAELDCLVDIASIYDDLGKYQESIDCGGGGVTMMKRHFGENAPNYNRYGQLLNNIGKSHENLAQYSKAQHCYITAIEVYERALDYGSEHERESNITLTKNNLKVVQKNKNKHKEF